MSAFAEEQLKAFGVAQVLVILRQPAMAKSASTALGKHFRNAETSPQSSIAAALSLRHGGGGRPARVVVPPPMRVYPHLGIAFGTVDKQGLAALRQDKGNVKKVCSAPVFSLIRPNDVRAAAAPKTVHTWGISAMEVPAVWKLGYTGKGVMVGHLDTGCDGTHPALQGAIKEFAEFDLQGDAVTPVPSAHDTDEHGTHTAATIAGRPVKDGQRTVHVGVAPDAQLVTGIVIEGGNVVARVLGGMNWAVGRGIRILSMSLGFRNYTEDFRELTQILRDRNVLPVFAVGNEGPGTSRSPGNYPEALSVGAHDKEGNIADFSSSQRFNRPADPVVPDIVAPGVDIISAKPGGGFQSMDGSSMATPHVAGLAALLFSARPAATVDQIEAAIYASCQRGPGLPQEQANRGTPNAVRALEQLLGDGAAWGKTSKPSAKLSHKPAKAKKSKPSPSASKAKVRQK